MKRLQIFIVSILLFGVMSSFAQTDSHIKQPDLQTADFFDPTKKKEEVPYQFTTDWRLETGYVQWEERMLDTTSVYQHGLRLGATVDMNLPRNFSIQTGALLTFTYGQNTQHWRSLDAENVQVEMLKHNILQLQLTIPIRAYYTIKLWKQLNMFFYAGPQLQFGLTNYDIIDNQTSPSCTEWLQEQGVLLTNHDRYETKDIYRTSIQFGLGGGIEWDQYRVQAGYDFGLNNLMRTSVVPNISLKEWGWMTTFCYRF